MDLTTKLANMTLNNPLMPASGPLVGTGEKIIALSKYNLGALVTKTISAKVPDISRPFMQGEGNFIMNCEPWSEYDIEVWKNEFLPQVKKETVQPLFVSLGYSDDDMRYLIPQVNEFADAYEISTHYVGKDLAPMKKTIKMIRSLTDKPVYMKVSPHFPSPIEFAEMVLDNGGNGIVAINSLGPSMKIDLASRSVKIGNKDGQVWLSGPAIKPVALAFVNNVKRAVPECEIIGVGGVETAEDVIEFLLAGANAVQMLSAALLKGHELYGKILKDLPSALEKYSFKSVEDVVNTELRVGNLTYEKAYPVFDADACVLCGICEKVCPFFAISKDNGEMKADTQKCMGCGLCRTRCPKKAISGV
ncbi:MAG: 4Fe-4S binding protein [Candidatus Metalachnospira sp.]|nr:4Fe-4S binding protein [Candidatus Metalachnospira sp.]